MDKSALPIAFAIIRYSLIWLVVWLFTGTFYEIMQVTTDAAVATTASIAALIAIDYGVSPLVRRIVRRKTPA